MSSNANNVSDEFLEFEDWVELFNGGDTCRLGGKYLTDNLSVPNKYAFPSGYLAAGDWAFYWLDNDPEQGPFHAPFDGADFVGLRRGNRPARMAIGGQARGPVLGDLGLLCLWSSGAGSMVRGVGPLPRRSGLLSSWFGLVQVVEARWFR